MSEDQIWNMEVRLARMEERQVQLYAMVERSLAFHGDVANRLSALEHLRTKFLAVAGLIGLACSVTWDVLKSRLSN